MMSPGKDYAPCPHCSANNITHRRECWRCGHMLPYTIGLDGKPKANSVQETGTVSRAEIERLLNQAQTFDLEEERRREAEVQRGQQAEFARPAETPLKERALQWLRRRAERPSGA